VSLQRICGWYGISRQAHYQQKRQQQHQQTQASQVVELVRQIRHRHKRMGGRKLYHQLQPELVKGGIKLGRDRFFELLRSHHLLLKTKKQAYRTTWAGQWRCENLLAQASITAPNQAWVCDLTYLLTETGFLYLALVTDLYSRRIMGYDLSGSLSLEGATRAVHRAIAQAGQPLDGLIHHSDHGVQYTSAPYRDLLARYHIRSSMGQVGNCYDNAVAQRLNGILKLEYGLDDTLLDLAHAQLAVEQAVWLYNHERPHLALAYQIPLQVYVNYFTINYSSCCKPISGLDRKN
jgi:transposase InsO family protein